MNIQTLQINNQKMSSREVSDIDPDDAMVFPDITVAVVYMMHRYVTGLGYKVAIPTRSDAVFSVECARNTRQKAELLFDGEVIEFNDSYEEFVTAQEVLDFYADSASIVKAYKEKAAVDDFNAFIMDTKKIIAEGGRASKAAVKTYFILNTSTKLIKIGRSVRPSKRIKDIQGMAGAKLELLAVIDSDIEAELHIQFKQYRRTGEWFEDKDSLIAECIATLTSEGVS